MARTRPAAPASADKARIALILCVLALTLIGLVMVYSTSFVDAIDAGGSPAKPALMQAAYALVGVAFALILWRIAPAEFWTGPVLWVIWTAAMVLLFATALMGTAEYGAQRWLRLGPVSIQPSEFAKIPVLLMAIRLVFLQRSDALPGKMLLWQTGLGLGLPMVFLMGFQSDLGTTAICAVGIIAVLWMGGVSKKLILGGTALAAAVVVFAIAGTDYRSGRMVYLDPWNDGDGGYGTGYNMIRSYYAIAEGGILGVGLGGGYEKFQYLFASESDFIFAIVCEELGMVGALAVIGLFLAILYSGLRIAQSCENPVASLMAGGFTVMLVAQAFLNIGCAIGVLPTTGKPLPFISSGGSSMIASMMMVGMVLCASRDARTEASFERRRADLRIVRETPSLSRPSRREGARSDSGRTGDVRRPAYGIALAPGPRPASGRSAAAAGFDMRTYGRSNAVYADPASDAARRGARNGRGWL